MVECTVGCNPSSNSRTTSILKDVDPIPEANLLPAIVLNKSDLLGESGSLFFCAIPFKFYSEYI